MLLALGFGGALLYQSLRAPSSAAATQAPTGTSAQSLPPAPTGYEAIRGDDGWTTYTSAHDGLSIALPEGWKPYIDGGPGAKAIFNAFDSDPSYGLAANLGTPQFLITKLKAKLDVVTPRKFYQLLRVIYSRDPRVTSVVEMYGDPLPVGAAHVFRFTRLMKNSEQRSYTIFLVLHDGHWYQVLGAVPARQASSYLPVFNSIAQSLRFD